jgi:hypothetical protein
MRPFIQWAKVDFPDPEGPVRRIFSPYWIDKLIWDKVDSD